MEVVAALLPSQKERRYSSKKERRRSFQEVPKFFRSGDAFSAAFSLEGAAALILVEVAASPQHGRRGNATSLKDGGAPQKIERRRSFHSKSRNICFFGSGDAASFSHGTGAAATFL